jgi:hypothetical protein
MSVVTRKRPKPVLYPTRVIRPTAGATEDNFVIYASSLGCAATGYYGTLKVVRKTDARLLFPFEGAETLGPSPTKAAAIFAAEEKGRRVVAADLARPEQ